MQLASFRYPLVLLVVTQVVQLPLDPLHVLQLESQLSQMPLDANVELGHDV
jgi:hypothetical protein